MPVNFRPLAAIDARLLSTHNTGDTSYWRGLVGGLFALAPDANLLLVSNTPAPASVPQAWKDAWLTVPGSSRWWSLVRFPLVARQLRAGAVHTQYNVSPLVRNGVTTVHDVSFLIGPEWFQPRDRFLLRTQVPASMKRARRVITVSETSKREISRFVPSVSGKVVVTPNALGDNVRPLDPSAARAQVKEELGLEGPFILTLGTRWPRKNMKLAIESCAQLPTHLPHKLVVAGKAGWGDLPRNDRTLFPGYVSDELLSALYSAADLYLCPSFHEGFGIPLLEAFACGCPVLCSPGGALPEVAGHAAEVAPNFEPKTWANLTESLLTDSGKLEAMRQAGRVRVRDFSWSETARLTEQVYREVADDRP